MKMRAVRLLEIGKALAVAEMPVPEAGAREVLVKVKAAGICHTDEHYRAGDIKVHRLPITSLGTACAFITWPPVVFAHIAFREMSSSAPLAK
jgi:Zn-dependent alcohol dehydrogenase